MTDSFQNINRPAALRGIIFLLLVLFLITLSSHFILQQFGISKINSTVFFISRLLYWLCAALLWLYAVRIEKQPMLLWPEKNYNLLFYILSVAAIMFVLIAGLFCLQKILAAFHLIKNSTALADITAILKTNKPLLVFTCLTAGVTEEIIFRGYLLPRLAILFKSAWLAIIISSLLFGLMHFRYGTVMNVAGPVFIGLVFALHYDKFRNIKVIIAFHFLWDLSLLLLAVKKP